MAGSQRLKRMADTVQRELSELIRQELKDPRLGCLLYTSPSPRDKRQSRMPSSA